MLSYKLIRKNNKRAYIRVIEGEIFVYAPYRMPRKYLDQFVENNIAWIHERLKHEYVLKDGETISILEKKYIVHFGKTIDLGEKSLTIPNDPKIFQKVILSMTRDALQKRFESYPWSKGYQLRLGFYTTRWGSHSYKSKTIMLNAKLVFTDWECIDAIMIHEFMHIYHNNHSKLFYSDVIKNMPNYHETIQRLSSYSIPYIKKDA